MSEQTHGRDCPKVPHLGAGYLHDAESDSPYDVDGVMYCGRCHGWLGLHLTPGECLTPEEIVVRDSRGERRLKVVGWQRGRMICRNVDTGQLSYVRSNDPRIVGAAPEGTRP